MLDLIDWACHPNKFRSISVKLEHCWMIDNGKTKLKNILFEDYHKTGVVSWGDS